MGYYGAEAAVALLTLPIALAVAAIMWHHERAGLPDEQEHLDGLQCEGNDGTEDGLPSRGAGSTLQR